MSPTLASQWSLLTAKTTSIDTQDDFNKTPKKEVLDVYELSYNGKTLAFTMQEFGVRPEKGYALYIALHGGGGDPGSEVGAKGEERKRINNYAWHMMATGLYKWNFAGRSDAVTGALYVVPRGIVDDWNLHFRPESYVLFERLIETLLQPAGTPLIDSNRVFLTGFSAGGDGVYRLATNLSDRFAAVNMSAGHPGEALFENLANLPFCSQVGEMDPTITAQGVRAMDVVRANIKMDILKTEARQRGAPGNYVHDCFVYTQGYDYANSKYLGYGDHNNWEGAEATNWEFNALKKENLEKWLTSKATAWRDSTPTSSNAIDWMRQYTRDPIPSYVVWNLESRPRPPKVGNTDQDVVGWKPKRYFYWLYLRDAELTQLNPKPVVRASYNQAERWIQVDQPSRYIALLLNDQMFGPDKLTKPITVYPGPKDSRTRGTTITVTPSETMRQQTLAARGDKNLEFTAVVYFDWNPNRGWEVKTANSLDAMVPPVRARL